MSRPVIFRVVAVLIGILATLIVTEVALRLTSAALEFSRHSRRRAPIDGEMRILCVGESTTAGRWPGQLEEILEKETDGAPIRVINRGVVGIITDGVAARIAGWLDEDRPHLVITMLGINDEGNVLVYPRDGAQPWVMRNLRSLRLVNLLWRSAFSIGAPNAGEDPTPSPGGHLDEETRATLNDLVATRSVAEKDFRYAEVSEIQWKIISTDPGTPFYHLSHWMGLTLHHDSPERLDEFFAGETETAPPRNDEMARQREIELWAERTGDDFAALRLAASITRWTNDVARERQLLADAANNPEIAGLAWLRLADLESRRRDPDAVLRSLIKADTALPDDYPWSLIQGDIAFVLEAYDHSAEQYQRALHLRPDTPASHELLILGRIANAYEQTGDPARAAEVRAQRDGLELDRFREFTRFHYRAVVEEVRSREIPVIAMQYPLLSVESLRKLLDYREDVIYLENRTDFEAALLEHGYRKIFTDGFAGSFGHLTPQGNLLVAENVAATIIANDARINP